MACENEKNVIKENQERTDSEKMLTLALYDVYEARVAVFFFFSPARNAHSFTLRGQEKP